jgi:nucleoid-associated protein YgaU
MIMGLFSFIKEAGEKLFGAKEVQAATVEVQQKPSDAAVKKKAEDMNMKAGEAITKYIRAQNLDATGLTVTFDGAKSEVSVYGIAPDLATKEKIVLCCGNVEGVGAVHDQMTVEVAASEPEAQFYTVVKGDTLSKIAKQYYGDAMKYPAIFEANKPMLKHPDKIYPGQLLRIPAIVTS